MRGSFRLPGGVTVHPSMVRSIQHVGWQMQASATQTDTALSPRVDPSNTIVLPGGYPYHNTSAMSAMAPAVIAIRIALLSTGDYIRANRNNTPGDTGHHNGRCTVVEFVPGVIRVQRGTITIGSGSATGTTSLSPSVDLNRTAFNCLGWESSNGTSFGTTRPDQFFIYAYLNAANQVTAGKQVGVSSVTETINFEVWEVLL